MKEFFKNEGKGLKINKIINIYLYIEHLCFEELCKSLNEKYKLKIDENIIINIHDKMKKFSNKTLKNELPKALRRYISRYLISKKTIEKLEEKQLIIELYKSDLWWTNIKIEDIKKELRSLEEFKLTVAQSFSLYESIGYDDKEYIKSIVKDEDEDEVINNEPDDNIE